MAKIKDIYSDDDYYPFTLYCENQGFIDMTDLTKCEFDKLRNEPDVTNALLSKVKMLYFLYCKKRPAEFMSIKKVEPRSSVKSAIPDEEIEKQLELYFQDNSDKLIHIADVSKSIGKKVKRGDIVRILDQVAWCKTVDGTTFFYSKS